MAEFVYQGYRLEEPYDTWHFGNTEALANYLDRLVMSRVKTGTASSAEVLEHLNMRLPQVGLKSLITAVHL